MSRKRRAEKALDRRKLLKAAASAAGAAALGRLADAAESSAPFLEAYASPLSCRAGDRVSLHVSTKVARYSVEIARLGATRQVVFTRDNLPGAQHPQPPDASSHGCHWPAALEVPVPDTW
jgi:hypothetical protein